MKRNINAVTILLMLIKSVTNSNGFLLHGSAGPLTARLGGAVLLPCFVDRPLPLEELEVNWRRTDSDTIVHLFQEGQSSPESQGDAYRGRAHFFSQEIPKGNVSLLLEGVKTVDAGVYECVVYKAQEYHEIRVEIQEVEWLVVTGADEPVYAHAGEDVTLSCSVDTHVNVTELQVEWRKTDDDSDIMVLLYADGGNRSESQDGRYSGRAEFFTEEIPKGNFSMKLRKVRMEDKGEFRCEVHSNNDSANTTARIAALGYSSLHRLLLWLCIAVTPVVLLTGALSVWNLDSKSKWALLSHWSHVTVPPNMVFAAFILWGLTEGSARDAVTSAVISLLNIPLLFIMAPYVVSTAKPRKYVYFSGSFGLPLLNSVALAVALKLKADTGKQPLDLWLIVLISGSVFLFGWFVIQISAYCLAPKKSLPERLTKVFALLQRRKDLEPEQRSHDCLVLEVLSPTDPKELNKEQGSHDNEEAEASSPLIPMDQTQRRETEEQELCDSQGS